MTHVTFALRAVHDSSAALRRRARVRYGAWAVGLSLTVLVAVCARFALVEGPMVLVGRCGFLVSALLLLGFLRFAIQTSVYRSVARNTLAMRAAIVRAVAAHGPMETQAVAAHLGELASHTFYDLRGQIDVLIEEGALTEAHGMLDVLRPEHAK